jgi:2-polyprenyl-3-methyl-5-hydroxy-6-metoxy-1,4-benzoquinol methylase
MNISSAHTRLSSLWGNIDEQHNSVIATRLNGRRVLDIGCGYGSLVNYLRARGFESVGIDSDPDTVEVGKQLFPKASLHVLKAEEIQLDSNIQYDTITLKDCFHHLVVEGDAARAFERFRLLLRPQGRIVILDPNPTVILRIARKLIRHNDPEAPADLAQRYLENNGFKVLGIEYHETIGLPLSGGYVGPRFVPNLKVLNRTVASLNHWLSRGAVRLRLGPSVCWRYMIYADRV